MLFRSVPTPVVAARLLPPTSRMGPLTPDEFAKELAESDLMREYGTPVNRESACEMLAKRAQTQAAPSAPAAGGSGKTWLAAAGGALAAAITSTAARTIGRELVRGVFGMLSGRTPRGTSRSRW